MSRIHGTEQRQKKRYEAELVRASRLDAKEREMRVQELLREYRTEWIKGTAEILTASQLARYVKRGAEGSVSELTATPDLQKRLPKPAEK